MTPQDTFDAWIVQVLCANLGRDKVAHLLNIPLHKIAKARIAAETGRPAPADLSMTDIVVHISNKHAANRLRQRRIDQGLSALRDLDRMKAAAGAPRPVTAPAPTKKTTNTGGGAGTADGMIEPIIHRQKAAPETAPKIAAGAGLASKAWGAVRGAASTPLGKGLGIGTGLAIPLGVGGMYMMDEAEEKAKRLGTMAALGNMASSAVGAGLGSGVGSYLAGRAPAPARSAPTVTPTMPPGYPR